MAFKIALSPTYKAEVIVITPGQNGGNDKSTMKVTYNRYTLKQLESLRELPQQDVMRQAVANITDLVTDSGEQIEFSEDVLERLMEIPQALKAMSETFWESQYSARSKN